MFFLIKTNIKSGAYSEIRLGDGATLRYLRKKIISGKVSGLNFRDINIFLPSIFELKEPEFLTNISSNHLKV